MAAACWCCSQHARQACRHINLNSSNLAQHSRSHDHPSLNPQQGQRSMVSWDRLPHEAILAASKLWPATLAFQEVVCWHSAWCPGVDRTRRTGACTTETELVPPNCTATKCILSHQPGLDDLVPCLTQKFGHKPNRWSAHFSKSPCVGHVYRESSSSQWPQARLGRHMQAQLADTKLC